MAKIRDYAVSVEAATVTSMVCEMPIHEIGDLLIAAVNKDSTPSFNTPSGWDVVQTQASAGAYGGIYAKRAATTSEAVTFTYATETAMAIIVSIKGCFGSTVANAISDSNKSGADSSTVPLDGGTITPSYDNSLIFSFLSTDTGLAPMALPGWVNIYGGDTGQNSGALSYTYQKTKAAITHPGYWGLTQDDSRAFMVVVRDDTYETEVDAYVDRTTNPCTQLTPHMGLGTTAALIAANKGSWKTATPLTIASINGKTATWMAVSATADTGYNPFRSSTALAGTSSKTVLYGNQFTFTSPPNLTTDTGVIFGTWTLTLPRDYIDIGKSSTGGMLTGIASSANGSFWCIGGQFDKTTLPDKRMNYAIEVSTTDTDYYTTATPPTLSAITDLYIINQSYFGATAVKFSELWLLNETVIAGGTTANPINFLAIVLAVNEGSGHIPLLVQQGSAATSWTRLKFGGGDPIHALVNLRTFQFPAKADGVDYLDFHVSNNVLGVEFYGKSGDELKFTNCVFTSDSSYYWRFNASHNSGATLDFSGTSVVNATVTLQSTSDLTSVAFINCPTFTQNAASLTSCTFSNTKVTSAAPADAALISDCTFTSSGTGYAIEIGGTAASFTLNGCTFTGYAASNGSTGNEAIYVSIASGNMTITITGGGSTPSIRTAGATVNVILSVPVTLSVVDEATDPVEGVQVYFQKSATGKTWNYTSHNTNNSAGDATFDVNEAVDTDLPQTGWLHVWDASTNTKQNYRYQSWSGLTFTLRAEVTFACTGGGTSTSLQDSGHSFITLGIQEGDTVRNTTTGAWAVVDEIVDANNITTSPLSSGVWTSGNTYSFHTLAVLYNNTDLIDIPIFNGQTDSNGDISTTYNYSAYGVSLPVTIRVRRSTQGSPDYVPYTTSGTIISSGFSGTIVIVEDTVAQPPF